MSASQHYENAPNVDHRERLANRPHLAGVVVREHDIEPVKGIRTIAVLFRGMAMLLLVLMALQVFLGATSTIPISVGVLFANAVRLIIFAGLLWAAGDLAILWVKSHYDIRATRILVARIESAILEGDVTIRTPAREGGSRGDSAP